MNPKSATALIVVLTVFMAFTAGVYWAAGLDGPARSHQLLWYVAWWWTLTLWVVMDARERHLPLAFDQGLFVYLAWPVYIPVYLVRSRGVMGLVWLGAFVGIYVAVVVATFIAVHAASAIWAAPRG